MAMLIMSVTSLMTKYGDNNVEHKISTLLPFLPLLGWHQSPTHQCFHLERRICFGFPRIWQQSSNVQPGVQSQRKKLRFVQSDIKTLLKWPLFTFCNLSLLQAGAESETCLYLYLPEFVNSYLHLPVFVNAELGQIQAITGRTWQHSWANSKIFALQILTYGPLF